jgi:predicted dinucleotide-utilizing enzyme
VSYINGAFPIVEIVDDKLNINTKADDAVRKFPRNSKSSVTIRLDKVPITNIIIRNIDDPELVC